MNTFIHLRAHSDYSLGLGAIKIKELTKKCVDYKIPAVGLADHGNLFGSLEFSQACIKAGVQPIIGCLLNISYEKAIITNHKSLGEILIIAKNKQGYTNLIKIVSESYSNKYSFQPYIDLSLLLDSAPGLICILGLKNSPVGKYISENRIEEAKKLLLHLQTKFIGDLYLEVQRNYENYDEQYERNVLSIALELNIPIVATNDIYFLTKEMFTAQDALYCISQGRQLDEKERLRISQDSYLKEVEVMQELFKDLPEAIANTINIAKKCLVFSETRKPLLPSFSQADNLNEDDILSKTAFDGLLTRIAKLKYQVNQDEYKQRLEYELSVIIKMRFSGYFLIVSDFIKWSKKQGIPVGPGRGSGAGSLVAWALDITDLDPIKFGLLFERFLNPDRISMPDFDIDFCQERREEVINYVKNKYGEDRVANIITFGKLQPRAVLRDVGRVLGISYFEVDRICKMVPNNPANPITLKEAIELDYELQRQRDINPTIEKLLSIGLQLEGMNRHVSTHAAGVVIADRPIVEIVPLYKEENSPMPIIQYNMKAAEDAGLVKFDFLGLKTLTVISWTTDLIRQNKLPSFDILEIPLDDPKTFHLLSKGETVGVFQFESAGMKEAIKKLKPDKIEDLIALGSLYRPGPMDNIPSYINRKHGFERPIYLHPKLEEILKETYGIIVYQEQVILIAQSLAGYSLGEADLLRKAMGKKIKVEMEANRQIFIEGAIKNGIDKNLAEEIFNLIDKFASYGFNKSHAAAYALISYQTAYLKANYPLEFYVASLNLEINDSDKINFFLCDAKNTGIEIKLPDINKSHSLFKIDEQAIRFGLAAIKNVGKKAIEEVIAIRDKEEPFYDIENFCNQLNSQHINKRMLENLVKSGALDSIELNRNKIFTGIEKILIWVNDKINRTTNKQNNLFSAFEDEYDKFILKEVPDWDLKEKLENEFLAFGFYLSKHPIEEHIKKLKKLNITFANEIDFKVSNKAVKLNFAGVITSKKIKSSIRGKFAFIQLSDNTGIFDVSIFDEKLLVKYNEQNLLDIGKSVYITTEARKDNNGLRVIIENLIGLEEAIKDVQTILHITIKNNSALDIIKESISDTGIPFSLSAKLDTGEVTFKKPNTLFINKSKLPMLKTLDNIEILEE